MLAIKRCMQPKYRSKRNQHINRLCFVNANQNQPVDMIKLASVHDLWRWFEMLQFETEPFTYATEHSLNVTNPKWTKTNIQKTRIQWSGSKSKKTWHKPSLQHLDCGKNGEELGPTKIWMVSCHKIQPTFNFGFLTNTQINLHPPNCRMFSAHSMHFMVPGEQDRPWEIPLNKVTTSCKHNA